MKAAEILVNDEWVPASPDMFRAWTGQRRIFGIEYHGPVWNLGVDPEKIPDASPYSGPRACTCGECQRHVEPRLRLN